LRRQGQKLEAQSKVFGLFCDFTSHRFQLLTMIIEKRKVRSCSFQSNDYMDVLFRSPLCYLSFQSFTVVDDRSRIDPGFLEHTSRSNRDSLLPTLGW
jgi:hypothetical protein